ncbi:translation initiation factor IF-2-like [Panthera tigris]|uniref:translation initiation factor IF-2-like n=1 Tax=Panthera tigris TaxID=9694 RepID=UPI001C6F6CD3|nr:translation initiation factor IF-2-like [Panthera tigris]
MPPTCQQARSRPPSTPPAASQPPSCGPSSAPRLAPTPTLTPQRAALQGSQPPAGFCPHRRISRPASLKSRRLNLRTRPRTSLAVAAARGGTRAWWGERARLRAGLGSWKSGLELAGVGEGAGDQGVGPQTGLSGPALTGPGARPAPHRAGPSGKASSGARREAGPEAACLPLARSPGSN